jgi:hypothetical protein
MAERVQNGTALLNEGGDRSKAWSTLRSAFGLVSLICIAYRVGAGTLFAIGRAREVNHGEQILKTASNPIEHWRGRELFER